MAARTKSPKVSVTKNYRLFARNDDNRPLDVKKHKRLYLSMKKYGFLSCFPIVCCRNGKKQLIVKDGQHRLTFAESLKLPVYWIEEAIDFDVAVINCTSRTWVLRDFAEKYARQGVKVYQKGLEFAEKHSLPIGVAFALLGGTTTYGNVAEAFVTGKFKVKDQAWADVVAWTYSSMLKLSTDLRNARFLEACMGACRVDDFDAKRLVQNARRCREKLVSYSTRDAYLVMLEDVYNFGRKTQLGLKAAATMVMRQRAAVQKR